MTRRGCDDRTQRTQGAPAVFRYTRYEMYTVKPGKGKLLIPVGLEQRHSTNHNQLSPSSSLCGGGVTRKCTNAFVSTLFTVIIPIHVLYVRRVSMHATKLFVYNMYTSSSSQISKASGSHHDPVEKEQSSCKWKRPNTIVSNSVDSTTFMARR